MNDWRIHAFAELAPYTRPEGERMHAAGSLVGVASEVRPDPGASWSIFNPPVVDELVVRGADTSGEDPEAPAGGDLAALLDAWATGAPTGVPLQLELPVALRGAPAVLAARGFTPVSTFAVRRVEGEPRPSAWASKPGRKLREVTAEDRAGVAGLLEELHAADADAATGAWAHPQLREHLLDYAGRVVDVPVLAVIAEYFGLVAGVANFAAPGTVAPRTSRERSSTCSSPPSRDACARAASARRSSANLTRAPARPAPSCSPSTSARSTLSRRRFGCGRDFAR